MIDCIIIAERLRSLSRRADNFGKTREELIEEIRMKGDVRRPRHYPGNAPENHDIIGGHSINSGAKVAGSDISLGQRVKHPKFGEGVVLNYEGNGTNARVQINFDNVGGKWLVMSYAKLEVI